MIFNNLKNSFVSAAALLVLVGMAVPVLAAPVKNIVAVHGAFGRRLGLETGLRHSGQGRIQRRRCPGAADLAGGGCRRD
jgi:hypothetical protein